MAAVQESALAGGRRLRRERKKGFGQEEGWGRANSGWGASGSHRSAASQNPPIFVQESGEEEEEKHGSDPCLLAVRQREVYAEGEMPEKSQRNRLLDRPLESRRSITSESQWRSSGYEDVKERGRKGAPQALSEENLYTALVSITQGRGKGRSLLAVEYNGKKGTLFHASSEEPLLSGNSASRIPKKWKKEGETEGEKCWAETKKLCLCTSRCR